MIAALKREREREREREISACSAGRRQQSSEAGSVSCYVEQDEE
jgi:hypothetical protein